MSLDYEIDAGRGRITMHGHATLTDEEMVHCVSRLRADPGIRLSMPTLADLSNVDRLEVTSAGINGMLAVLRATGHPHSAAKVALFTGREAQSFIARLIEALAEADETTVRFRAFTDRSLAERWLDEP